MNKQFSSCEIEYITPPIINWVSLFGGKIDVDYNNQDAGINTVCGKNKKNLNFRAYDIESQCLKGLTWYCRDRVSSCNIYAAQQDTQSVSISEFIQHLC